MGDWSDARIDMGSWAAISAAALRLAAINCGDSMDMGEPLPPKRRAYRAAVSLVMVGGETDMRISSSCFMLARAAAKPRR